MTRIKNFISYTLVTMASVFFMAGIAVLSLDRSVC